MGEEEAGADDWPCPCGPGSVARTLRPRLPVLLRYLRCKRCLPRGQICASELSGKGTSKAQRRFSKPIQARHEDTRSNTCGKRTLQMAFRRRATQLPPGDL